VESLPEISPCFTGCRCQCSHGTNCTPGAGLVFYAHSYTQESGNQNDLDKYSSNQFRVSGSLVYSPGEIKKQKNQQTIAKKVGTNKCRYPAFSAQWADNLGQKAASGAEGTTPETSSL